MILREALPSRVIALEGIDGAGKTTCRDLVVSRLRAQHRSVVGAGEFMSPIGDWLSNNLASLSFLEKILYFAADRASSLRAVAASDATTIVWDRYVMSAFAYRLAELDRLERGSERAECLGFVSSVNEYFPRPLFTIWLQVPPTEAQARKPGGLENLEAVHRAYGDLFLNTDEPFAIVDATDEASLVADKVVKLIDEFV